MSGGDLAVSVNAVELPGGGDLAVSVILGPGRGPWRMQNATGRVHLGHLAGGTWHLAGGT